jgi:hypothetical protein
MDGKIKKILDNLEESGNNIGESKKVLNEHIERLGYSEQFIELQRVAWKNIDNFVNKDQTIISSTLGLSEKIVEQSRNLSGEIRMFNINASTDTTASMVATAGTMVISGVAVGTSFNGDTAPSYYTKLVKFIAQKDNRPEIYRKLKEINSALAEEYNNAWNSFHTLTEDKTRSPMFLMREVINKLLFIHFAPQDSVENYCKENKISDFLNQEGKIKHSVKISYIASKITDNNKKQAFLAEEKAYNQITNVLSSAKNPGGLDKESSTGILYQADELIKLLLDSVER